MIDKLDKKLKIAKYMKGPTFNARLWSHFKERRKIGRLRDRSTLKVL